jgi:hypothetical protein
VVHSLSTYNAMLHPKMDKAVIRSFILSCLSYFIRASFLALSFENMLQSNIEISMICL